MSDRGGDAGFRGKALQSGVGGGAAASIPPDTAPAGTFAPHLGGGHSAWDSSGMAPSPSQV